MKKLLSAALIAAAAFAALPASANVITTLHESYASGAQFTGQLTFSDNYQSLLGVNGNLTAGSYGNVHFGWTWTAGNGLPNPYEYDGNPNTREDWLMDGTGPSHWQHYIGLSWLANTQSLSILLSPNVNVYFAGINSQDATTSASTGNVPEPGTLMLLGLGAIGAAAIRRRRG